MRVALRRAPQATGVTNIELFFDLVYAFAVTQLSHFLLDHAGAEGVFQTAILLGLVWLAWSYTVWVTNWLDPDRFPVRLALVGLMLVSLAMSAGLPDAFGARGLVLGLAFAAMRVGRSLFAVLALRGDPLRRSFERLLAWGVLSSALAVAGGLATGHLRELLWLAVVALDLGGGWVGFYTPGLGRADTRDWDISGSHMAERCSAFVLIALGESIVVIGASVTALPVVTPAAVAALMVAFAGSIGLWWVYFDRSAGEAARVIAASPDPGRLGRSAYTAIHPVIVAGVIVVAAGDHRLIDHPVGGPDAVGSLLILGGAALFLAGHALFKGAVFGVVSWPRIGGIALLAVLGATIAAVPVLAIAVLAAAVIAGVAVSDRYLFPSPGA